ncbi:MAG: flagellar hook-length control protein FliK [Pseudohongiella sp.]|nr:flagellar hook-length control protein FliK [Pseudohongiella sp.]
MKLPQDTTPNMLGSTPLPMTLNQGGDGLANQSKRGFAENLRHQISVVAETARQTVKTDKHEPGRQTSVDKPGAIRRGTELPAREQKLPRSATRNERASKDAEPAVNVKSNKQVADDSQAKNQRMSDAVNNGSAPEAVQHLAGVVAPYTDIQPSAISSASLSADEPYFSVTPEQTTPATATGDKNHQSDVVTQNMPAEPVSAAGSYDPAALAHDKTSTSAGALDHALSLASLTIDQPATFNIADMLSGFAFSDPAAQLAAVVATNTVDSPRLFMDGDTLPRAMVDSGNRADAAIDVGAERKHTMIMANMLSGSPAELPLNNPMLMAAPVAIAAGTAWQQTGNRQFQPGSQTIPTVAADPSGTVPAASGSAITDVMSTTNDGFADSSDANMTFSEKLLNQKTSVPGSAQYASMLAQSGSAAPGYSDAPVANGLLSMLVSGQTSAAGSLETTSSSTALSAGAGNSAGSSASGLSASLYTLDQRQQAAAEARLVHAQTTRGMDTSLASTSALKLPGLDAAFGQSGWIDRVGRQMLLQSAQGSSSAQIRLDPPELGSLTVRIQLVDQAAAVNFVSPHAMVRDALEQQSVRLHEMFAEQGIDLIDVSVSDQSAHPDGGEERESGTAGSGSSARVSDDKQAPENSVKKSESLIDFYA